MGEAKQSTGPLRKDGQDRILQYYVDIQLRWRHLHLESKKMVLAELKSYNLSTGPTIWHKILRVLGILVITAYSTDRFCFSLRDETHLTNL